MIYIYLVIFAINYKHVYSANKNVYERVNVSRDRGTLVGLQPNLTYIKCAYRCMESSSCFNFEYNNKTNDCLMYGPFGAASSTYNEMYVERCPLSSGFHYDKRLDLCYKVHSERKKFLDALYACRDEISFLIIKVDTLDRLKFLKDVVTDKTTSYWIGLHDYGHEGTYLWLDGTVLFKNNTVWQTNHQDWLGKECCEINPDYGWKVTDDSCDAYHFFICEYNLRLYSRMGLQLHNSGRLWQSIIVLSVLTWLGF